MSHETRWTAEKIANRLELIAPLAYRRRAPLGPFRYRALAGPLEPPPVAAQADDSGWPSVGPGDYWGGWRQEFVLRVRFAVPTDWPTEAPVVLALPLGVAGDFSHPEALAYVDGRAYAACDRHHQEFQLAPEWQDGQPHTLALHGWAGLLGSAEHPTPNKLLLQPCFVAQVDRPTRDFVAAARVALGVARALPAEEPARGQLLTALDDAFKLLDTREPFDDRFYRSLPAAHLALQQGIQGGGQPLPVQVTAAGHAHIDTAWLWPLAETRRKAERTFHSVIRLMDQFPGFHFTQSQPQLYEFIRQDQPTLYEAIRARVGEGRWEVIGGMWVEADCNLSGAESLARQFMLGRNFFRREFGPGAESPVLWLPDVFGYAWNLPQLIKQAGLEYFFTIKIGWSQYNRLPFDSFWWQGLDGTRVLTHFSPTPEPGGTHASTYNAEATPAEVRGTWTNYRQKDLGPAPLLMAYGYGDGGGGPTRDMIENLRLLESFPAMPQVRMGRVIDFFRDLERTAGSRLPVWNGELYLELHRGTYTTQGRLKRANRKAEFQLHDAEFLAAVAAGWDAGYTYPQAAFTRAWQLVCLNQFHDIIPGSSIADVYVDSAAHFREVEAIGAEVLAEALQSIGATMNTSALIVNPTSFARREPVFFPGVGPAWPGPTQPVEGGVLVEVGELPPYSLSPLSGLTPPAAAPLPLAAEPGRLENDFVRAEFDAAGNLVRVYDKRSQREVLPAASMANQFQAFEDRPLLWDAWDVDIFFDDKCWLAEPAGSIRVVEAGPLRAALEIRRRILNSPYTQRVSLRHNSPRLDFHTTIDWREKHILLKVAFPVEVFSPVATYDVQWGNVERPTHRNTSWDWARFETCAHKWVDLSEGGYGVSLINDCKYGHDIRDNVIRLSLLRAPTEPDPHADEGWHEFVYSLYPHAGRWGTDTVREAYALNDPLISWQAGPENDAQPASTESLVRVDAANVVIETVKIAEDGDDLIVRMYECQRKRGEVTLRTNFALQAAWRANLLEEAAASLPAGSHSVQLFIKPYEIVTLRLRRTA